jgi:site-specific DNA recombinase
MTQSTNGHGPKRAILYARVSTRQQAEEDRYSIPQQLHALREYCQREGFDVIQEVTDPGFSGASLERPGMDTVRDLVAGGGVDVVLAQDRDRFAREPAYLYLLREEFDSHGTLLRALNQHGDDSPEGQLTDGIMDQLGKFERAKFTERSRRGKIQRAREGKILPTRTPDYGFHYNADYSNYEVVPEDMEIVKRIFHMVGVENRSLRAVKRALEDEGIPTPTGKSYWHATTIKRLIEDDVYKPHSHAELSSMVSAQVLATLDPERSYGVWWWGRNRVKQTQVSEDGPNGKKTYRKHQSATATDPSTHVAVPVPDAGIPREWVEAARARAQRGQSRARPVSGGRFWELGGLIICGHCGYAMFNAPVKSGGNGKMFYYYRCSHQARNGKAACPNSGWCGPKKPRLWCGRRCVTCCATRGDSRQSMSRL